MKLYENGFQEISLYLSYGNRSVRPAGALRRHDAGNPGGPVRDGGSVARSPKK